MRQEVASARRSPEAEPASFADGLGVQSEREMCGSFQDVAAAVCHVGTGSGGSRGGGASPGVQAPGGGCHRHWDQVFCLWERAEQQVDS